MTDLTTEHLIDLCERGVVPESEWRNRDSAEAQIQLGKALALLRAGCEWRVASTPKTTADTLWVEITYKGFAHFDWDGGLETDTFYIPTDKRLRDTTGRDWY